jgi:peptidoglycan/xylan/chitin deacetylase (PgdA/CDA1 family)
MCFQRYAALPYKHTTAAFTMHMDRIGQSPLRPTLVSEIDLLASGRHLALTFDDGGTSALRAGEELCRRGWRGHFFIVTDLIGMRTFLDVDGIRTLRRCGHLIGSHSHTHPDIFRELSPAQMASEWRVSCERLADLLGEPCIAASVPGGDISERVLQSAADAGLRYLFTSEPCVSPRRVGACWVLGRFGPKSGTSAETVYRLAQFRGWHRALMVRRLKGLARRSAPALYRCYVKQTTRARAQTT